ncbi:hypothetical protein [Effusibacillus consociatus]|uniref:Uncharacterized protein n=1 Tax=Effusibacillus consociatus TaxID=1117041 RepID=A0ABV9Q4M1_9BACL
MSDADDLFNILNPDDKQGNTFPAFRLGTIPTGYTSGRPTVLFDGETTASSRKYPYLSSYTPAANDKVLLGRVGNGWAILGKII